MSDNLRRTLRSLVVLLLSLSPAVAVWYAWGPLAGLVVLSLLLVPFAISV